ncbi:hypothetical protein HY493_00070 [Candidatus Woesearchaeota archaeon]|nr:hypothetical protein [Candidatus Woesearchaeota archaeon]
MLEQFKFWKRKDELPPGELQPYPTGMEQTPLQPIPSLEPAGPSQDANFQQMAQLTSKTGEKDLELIAAKLDVLKAQLDNVMQRLDHLERTLQESKVRW